MIEILFVDWSLVSSYQTKTSVQAVNQSEDSKFEAEAREFSKILRSLFNRTIYSNSAVKGNNF